MKLSSICTILLVASSSINAQDTSKTDKLKKMLLCYNYGVHMEFDGSIFLKKAKTLGVKQQELSYYQGYVTGFLEAKLIEENKFIAQNDEKLSLRTLASEIFVPDCQSEWVSLLSQSWDGVENK